MGKNKDKSKKQRKGADKTALKTAKKINAKQKKMLEKLGEADIAEVVAQMEAEEARLESITEIACEPPSPRSSFTLTAHPEKEELVLFGGEFFNGKRLCVYNELFFYNIAKNEWKQIRSPCGPTPRSGHQVVAVATDKGQLWLFGGEHASPSQLQFFHYKDLWVLSLATRKWQKINAPNGPSARSGHRMVASKKNLIVFGGFIDYNHTYHYFNDVHVFSLENYLWQKIKVSGAIVPAPRSGGCMSACPDGKILLWGGYSKEQAGKDADRGITHTDMFELVSEDGHSSDKLKWCKVKAGGYKPLPRSSVGCTTAANGKAYCFGGVMDVNEDEDDLQGQFSDELLALDLTTRKWQQLELRKSKSKKDIDSSSNDVGLNDDEMCNSEKATTSSDGVFTVTVAGPSSSNAASALPKIPSLFPTRRPKNVPTPRMNAGLCVCKGKLYLYGGLFEEDNKQITFNDFYALDLHKLDEWKVLISNDANAHNWIDSESSDSENNEDDSSDDYEDDDDTSSSDMDTD